MLYVSLFSVECKNYDSLCDPQQPGQEGYIPDYCDDNDYTGSVTRKQCPKMCKLCQGKTTKRKHIKDATGHSQAHTRNAIHAMITRPDVPVLPFPARISVDSQLHAKTGVFYLGIYNIMYLL